MELKIWVEGIQRIVCGVTESTTCQDVVFALAHATGKIGRFTLIERWRNNERLLAPTDTPLKILMKWGEYSSDVQFILQRSDQQSSSQSHLTKTHQSQSQQQIVRQQQLKNMKIKISSKEENEFIRDLKDKQNENIIGIESDKIKKNLIGFCDNKEIGVVKGIQQKSISPIISIHDRIPSQSSTDSSSFSQTISKPINPSSTTPEYAYVTKKRSINNPIINHEIEFNSADVRNSLDKKVNLSNDNLIDVVFNARNNNSLDSIKPPIGVSSNGALVPPPYRDPPPPRSSPSSSNNNSISSSNETEINDVLLNNGQYKDLIQLIKYQREKISLQQADLTKFDAEIVLLENRERDQMQQLEAITRELNKTDQIFRQGSEQLQTLQYIEEENELVRQQEKTLKSEITLLRSKLANCETELLQCKNKIRLLLDEIQLEQRVLNRQYDNRQQIEKHFLTEVEKIQIEIDSAIQQADSTNRTSDNLKREVGVIENAIAEKKKQVEQLVNEMKEVNLKSLAVAPPDEIHHLIENSNRPGSTRRMIGSPRQLENAVPTSKNPHGVWV